MNLFLLLYDPLVPPQNKGSLHGSSQLPPLSYDETFSILVSVVSSTVIHEA